MRGSEALGNGLAALFVLENGFFASNGALAQGGAGFGRQAYVGLQGALGTVTLGRQYDPMLDYLQPLTVTGQWAGSMGAHADDVDNLSNTNRVNNSIKFRSVSYRGFSWEGLYSIGGVAGRPTQNQIWSLGAGYSGSWLTMGLGYFNARNPNVSFYGNTPNKGSSTANNIGTFGSTTTGESIPAYAGFASAETLSIAGAALRITMGDAQAGAVATRTQFDSLGSQSGPNPLGYSGNVAFNSFEINGDYRITPALLVGVGVNYTKRSPVNGDNGARYQQAEVGTVYSLSKRTDLYAICVYQHASGRDSLAQEAVASINGFSPSSRDEQTAMRVAVRHKF
ncbi:putative porin [Paraburkholderia unamae]|uniref:porin n=1 Tax=Paraburkholderia unamae TaxID=219649 RepID=UPI000DC47B52|nr:porin [Paraburkholderia unamae]RAR47502.1 putative porin [Paraburkholderia unamae]